MWGGERDQVLPPSRVVRIPYSSLILCSFVCCGNCVSVGFFVLVFSFITLDDIWWILNGKNLSSSGCQRVKDLPWREINMCPCSGGKYCSRENESRYSLNETLALSLLLSLSGEKNYLKEKYCNVVLVVQAFKFFMIWSTSRYQISQFSNPLKQCIKLVQIQVNLFQFLKIC